MKIITKRARIDNYFANYCCWTTKAPCDTALWLELTLPDTYQLIGV